jgi:large subunit ribosomal protein L18
MANTKRKKRVYGTAERPRLVVFRSLRYIYGQIIDDESQKVLLTMSSISKNAPDAVKKAKTKVEQGFEIGKALAEMAVKKNINTIIFDRNGYLYHGRIKALADGAREGGLKF